MRSRAFILHISAYQKLTHLIRDNRLVISSFFYVYFSPKGAVWPNYCHVSCMYPYLYVFNGPLNILHYSDGAAE